MQIHRLKRREFFALLGGATAVPLAAPGVLTGNAQDDPENAPRFAGSSRGFGNWAGETLATFYRRE